MISATRDGTAVSSVSDRVGKNLLANELKDPCVHRWAGQITVRHDFVCRSHKVQLLVNKATAALGELVKQRSYRRSDDLSDTTVWNGPKHTSGIVSTFKKEISLFEQRPDIRMSSAQVVVLCCRWVLQCFTRRPQTFVSQSLAGQPTQLHASSCTIAHCYSDRCHYPRAYCTFGIARCHLMHP